MDSAAISKVCHQVYTRFPKLQGVKPKVNTQGSNFLLVFSTKSELAGGKTLEQLIRVVADADGNIIKISSSRG